LQFLLGMDVDRQLQQVVSLDADFGAVVYRPPSNRSKQVTSVRIAAFGFLKMDASAARIWGSA
jgi:hypothetical protein